MVEQGAEQILERREDEQRIIRITRKIEEIVKREPKLDSFGIRRVRDVSGRYEIYTLEEEGRKKGFQIIDNKSIEQSIRSVEITTIAGVLSGKRELSKINAIRQSGEEVLHGSVEEMLPFLLEFEKSVTKK